jgi:hypothetical protein
VLIITEETLDHVNHVEPGTSQDVIANIKSEKEMRDLKEVCSKTLQRLGWKDALEVHEIRGSKGDIIFQTVLVRGHPGRRWQRRYRRCAGGSSRVRLALVLGNSR